MECFGYRTTDKTLTSKHEPAVKHPVTSQMWSGEISFGLIIDHGAHCILYLMYNALQRHIHYLGMVGRTQGQHSLKAASSASRELLVADQL